MFKSKLTIIFFLMMSILVSCTSLDIFGDSRDKSGIYLNDNKITGLSSSCDIKDKYDEDVTYYCIYFYDDGCDTRHFYSNDHAHEKASIDYLTFYKEDKTFNVLTIKDKIGLDETIVINFINGIYDNNNPNVKTATIDNLTKGKSGCNFECTVVLLNDDKLKINYQGGLSELKIGRNNIGVNSWITEVAAYVVFK